jgi:hypothetical protein
MRHRNHPVRLTTNRGSISHDKSLRKVLLAMRVLLLVLLPGQDLYDLRTRVRFDALKTEVTDPDLVTGES